VRVLHGGSGRLPRPLTSFTGRERELAEARRLLERSCLLTLTGPGGSGKTRLCVTSPTTCTTAAELTRRAAAGVPRAVLRP
jgi:predicted ATPase